HKGFFSKIKFIFELKAKRFDTAISFHRSMSRMLIAALSGIRKRVGYYTKKRSWLLTDSVKPLLVQPHRVEYFLNITRSIGIDTENRNYEFKISEDSMIKAAAILKEAGIKEREEFFLINPGGNWPPKRWPCQLYASLCKSLKQKYDKRIVITGASKDIALADSILKISNGSAVSIAGKTTLRELGAVVKQAALVVANDSGPMHIAISQNVPTVALFGPTSPKITGPYGDGNNIVLNKWFDCDIPCYAICDDYRCMESITVEDVMDAIERLKK
ncbi:MAG: glycosyltransferase family 9 protein, partial [Candidatus Omnitrophica bacterium]|nr:glycosyltransferase family 9 protein [Candidatus Omnitrophota bacterium]